ncbi:MAG: hypothetical protein HKP62_01535 [Sulfurovum sp.]|nr:efflux RND transporter permease subunit [Sulfurovum sp.]NNJ44677.1 hypothetical protein [Sulfurovum sp.]
MKPLFKTLTFVLLVVVNLFYINKITIVPMNIESFFPQDSMVENNTSILKNSKRILFSANTDKKALDALREDGILNDVMNLENFNHTSMLIFRQSDQHEIISKLNNETILGPPIVGEILSKEFISDTKNYLMYVIPFLLPIFILLTSLRYLFLISIEMLFISFLLLSSIAYYGYEINVSFSLSLVFSYIYAFTILNYFFYGNIDSQHLWKGLMISLLTTILSAVILMQSSFSIIADFGKSLLMWMIVLVCYLFIRRFFIKVRHFDLSWLDHFRKDQLIAKYIIFFLILLGILALIQSNKLIINLNPVSSSYSSQHINKFEQEHILAQPVVIGIRSHECTYREVNCVKELSAIVEDITHDFPLKMESIMDINSLYYRFTGANIQETNREKLAQFYLALEFSSNPEYVMNSDTTQAYMLLNISIKSSTQSLTELMYFLNNIDKKYQYFTIDSLGHLAQIQQYKEMFFEETFMGMSIMLGFIIIVFLFYYGNISMIIAFIPALITLCIFFALHVLFSVSISLMSLVSLILFIGLIGDNIIHIFICYKKNGTLCFKTVYKPIILSNILMIISLFGMAFTGTLLQKFGLELGLLLAVHLLLLVYVLPILVVKYLKY